MCPRAPFLSPRAPCLPPTSSVSALPVVCFSPIKTELGTIHGLVQRPGTSPCSSEGALLSNRAPGLVLIICPIEIISESVKLCCQGETWFGILTRMLKTSTKK